MNVFNGNPFRTSAPTTYGFDPGHVFAIREGVDEVLFKYIHHDRHVLTASPLANPELRQVFTQEQIHQLVQGGRLDPRIEQNQISRQKLLARSPDIKSLRDLPDAERDQLEFNWKLCRHVVQMYHDGKTSLTDKALRKTIAKAFMKLEHGIDLDADDACPAPGERKIKARKHRQRAELVSPATLRHWIRKLEEHEWDILALRDHRKGRVGCRAPKITDPHAVALMSRWVQAYLDLSRPSVSTLYKLMVGSIALEEENLRRERQGNLPLKGTDAPSFAAVNAERALKGIPPLPVPSKSTFERAIRRLDSFAVAAARRGEAYARRKHKISGKRRSVLFPG